MRMIPYAEEDEESEVFGTLSPGEVITVETTGQWFCAYQQRVHGRQSYKSLSSSSEEEEEEEEEEECEDDQALLLGLDPKEWKKQDHYAVLGLPKSRWKATDDQVKRAYKRKVLLHHPDKRRARGLLVQEGEDDYFTCITRAYETLGNPAKRRSFDSVDPEFDDAVPGVTQNKDSFYNVFRPAFERNTRWSNKKRVPHLGDENTDFDHVNTFYKFWYEFDSWREFSYKDEEEKEKGENREERRWIERQNKAARQKLKKEEVARIRLLVDNAYTSDPRIQKFMEEEKEKKLAQKRARQDAIRQRAEEEERARTAVQEEERKKKEKEEEEAKATAAAAKKEKEAHKKQLRKERKSLRQMAKDYEYFSTSEDERIKMLEEVDKLSELLSLASLQDLNVSLSAGDKDKAKEAFLVKMAEVQSQLEKDKRQHLEAAHKSSSGGGGGGGGDKKTWADEELQMLIKAVNLFPAGTQDRWDVIAAFIGQHVAGSKKNARDVLSKAKELQKNDMSLRQGASKQAFSQFEKEHKSSASGVMDVPSQRLESAAEAQLRETGTNPAPWNADEQKLLEQAMKTYGPNTPERWERIAESVPNRSKKDCMKRYKELCEIVRAKKAAQEAAKAKKS